MATSIKQSINKLIYYTGLVRLCLFMLNLLTQKKLLMVFTFHRITDSNPNDYFMSYDQGLDKTVHQNQIEAIDSYFKTLTIAEFVKIVTNEKKLTKNSALITYDDGDYDFIQNALPALQKFNCPATIFVPTDYVDSDKKFWHLQISNLMHYISWEGWQDIVRESSTFPNSIATIIKSAQTEETFNRFEICPKLVNALDKMMQAELDSCVEKMVSISRLEYKLPIRCMTWEELKHISKFKIDIESHSKTHRKMAQLSDEEISREAVISKEMLETKLLKNVLSICYPAGSFDDRVARASSEAGYKVGFTTQSGIIKSSTSGLDLFKLKRFNIYGDSKAEASIRIIKFAIREMLKN